MIKEALKKISKKLAIALCVSAMCIGGAAVSAQAAESAEVQESSEGSAEIADTGDFLNFGHVVKEELDSDYYNMYSIKLKKSGRVYLDFISYGTDFYVTWYNSDGDEMFYWHMDYNDTLGFAKDWGSVDLLSGTYYIKVENRRYNYHNSGSYKMKATFEDAGANDWEPNDYYGNATPIKFSQLMKGQFARNDDRDFYKFRVTKDSDVTVKIASSQISTIYFNIYNQNGDKIVDKTVYSNDAGNISTKLVYELEAGIYYMEFAKYYNYTGAYSFKVVCPVTLGSKNVTLSKSKYEYDGKVKSPSVIVKNNSGKRLVKGRDYDVYAQSGRRNVGIYKVKVVFKGNYKGSAVKTLTIIPARTTITGIASKSNGIKIAWKQRKAGNATGYIVYRSVNGGAYKAIKVIRSTRTTAFTDTGANSWWDTYSYKVVVYKNLGGKTYKSVGSNGKSIYRY